MINFIIELNLILLSYNTNMRRILICLYNNINTM